MEKISIYGDINLLRNHTFVEKKIGGRENPKLNSHEFISKKEKGIFAFQKDVKSWMWNWTNEIWQLSNEIVIPVLEYQCYALNISI